MRPEAEQKAAIVTGAGGTGSGRAIALRLARAGHPIVVADVKDEGGRETVSLIEKSGGRALFCHTDVREERQVRNLIETSERAFGGLTLLVNNASGPEFRPDEPLERWCDIVSTDLVGTMHATRSAIDAMRRSGGGAIVNIASISALWHGRRNASVPGYDAAKAGIIRLTTALAPLVASYGVRVNCLAPGWIATDGPRQYWESLTPAQRLERGVPSRLLRPDQIADAVVMLATDETLTGRVMLWWSEDEPRLITWGDRGYEDSGTCPLPGD
jgi:NAD(P)-dependent dehydrogenase (short-subunit alcohol dehydrogenase family)